MSRALYIPCITYPVHQSHVPCITHSINHISRASLIPRNGNTRKVQTFSSIVQESSSQRNHRNKTWSAFITLRGQHYHCYRFSPENITRETWPQKINHIFHEAIFKLTERCSRTLFPSTILATTLISTQKQLHKYVLRIFQIILPL